MMIPVDEISHPTSTNSVQIYTGEGYTAHMQRPQHPWSAPFCPTQDHLRVESHASSYWRESINLLQQHVVFGTKRVKPGEELYRCGEEFEKLYLISAGMFKVMNLTLDGREQLAGIYFKGDWLGFDGIPNGQYGCTAIALDVGEVWSVKYETLLQVSAKQPELMRIVLAAMSAQLAHNRDVMLSMGTLASDERVCDFLLQWANALAERGMRTDQFNVYLSRADIGNYLGLRIESVSRSLTRLAQIGLIEFNEKGRRAISIPNLGALSEFIQKNSEKPKALLQ